ncbi:MULTISPECIES: transporter substrate-binding domain-containing protein [Clostridium]|jgi:putative glutamine transport system substrate-binding protein|uniref:Glutamine transport system substrate-binding protein n=3 Tax=Clostridium TaxID=1485 RepID=A0A9Q5CPW3_CLOBE|nr:MULTISPECIES: transporter substrate-binding domain-containing protein [Clostridium]AQS07004.1 major cell-binding factor precursor [Clostridium beijerinckii]MBA2883500.1 putative glutamine transport system substrate-binding protein [Clostridium beijerinckii]MBA2898687.1 putative glutamine transport system substrate-binding protein [Clostridium beijerinckii]MBA2908087.1 putative glutamine transport system substrate-binding protein [Clostridium beijerinckii]MBA9013365.1 putative glutamine tran
MKLRKLFLALGLGVCMMMAGCSSSTPTNTGGNTAEAKEIQAIKDRGVLKVGVKVDVPKYGYKNPQTGEMEGLEIDLSKAIAKKILGDESKVEFQGVTAKTRGPLLDNGEIDMVAATFTITDERKKSYNFSDPYIKDGVGLLVKKSLGASSLKDLDGKTIGVAQSATTKTALQKEAEKEGITLKFSELGGYPELKAALDSGRIDCFAVDASILNGYVDDSTVILNDRYDPQEYGIATKKDNTELAKEVNEVINDMKSSGEIDKLIAKWDIK